MKKYLRFLFIFYKTSHALTSRRQFTYMLSNANGTNSPNCSEMRERVMGNGRKKLSGDQVIKKKKKDILAVPWL